MRRIIAPRSLGKYRRVSQTEALLYLHAPTPHPARSCSPIVQKRGHSWIAQFSIPLALTGLYALRGFCYTPHFARTSARTGPVAVSARVARRGRDALEDGIRGRLTLLQAKSVLVLGDIKAYLERERPKVSPKSPEGQAIAYALSNWEALIRYVEDGDLEIDNNGAERSLRGVAVGRKNWLFFGSNNGGRTAAVLTSFITTCKRLDIDPFGYLRDIFERLSTHQSRLAKLLPDQWRAEGRVASTS